MEFKKQLSVEKPIVKGYNFYKSGKVQGIYTKQQEELFYIKRQVKSSYDKQGDKHKNIYIVKIITNLTQIHKYNKLSAHAPQEMMDGAID